MQRQEAIELAWKLTKSGKKHRDYERVVNLAMEYMILITGEGMEKLLFQFIQREDDTMFEQRKRITQTTTPAISSSIMKPFYKVSRNDKVKKRIDFKDPDKNKAIEEMLQGWFGAKRSKNKGLIHWLRTRFIELTFQDPNAWIVTQWDKPEASAVPEPHPYEVPAMNAHNFLLVNEELKWLFTRDDLFEFDAYNGAGEKTVEIGTKVIHYDQDWTVAITRIDKKLYLETHTIDEESQTIKEWNGKDYLETVYEPKLGFVAAFRVGYNRDGYTAGRTCVNPFHPAMAFFKKSIKTVSELDLTMTLHAFPQKLQYVQKCMGESKTKTCHSGYVNGTAEACSVCKGAGYKVHTTAQDAILLPMPESKEEAFDLDKMLVYKAPPIDLIKFQDEYTKALKQEAHLAVFNSQIFINPELQAAKTATEVDANMQGVYDTLEPYVEKISEIHKDIVYTFAHLAAVADPDSPDSENVFQYPEDLKLKTTTVLLNELKLVNDSGAPSFMRDGIGNDLAEINYSGDELGYTKFQIMHRFFPFNGKNPDEIAMLMSSAFVSKFTKVLYSNFGGIFKDIELEKPAFWFMKSYAKQWDIVKAKTDEYMKELESDPLSIDFGNAKDPGIDDSDPAPGDDPKKGEGNPGAGEDEEE